MIDRAAQEAYITQYFAPEDEALRWIQQEAKARGLPTISVRPHEGRLLYMLARMIGARKAVEIGTLAGYSGTWIARALPPDGRLITLEREADHAELARESFQRAGVAARVELREGDALETLEGLRSRAPFDFVFIDADKAGYLEYLAWAVDNLRSGGIVAAHNALRGGAVLQPQDDNDRAVALFNRVLADEPRLDSTIIDVGDGLAVGLKR